MTIARPENDMNSLSFKDIEVNNNQSKLISVEEESSDGHEHYDIV